jgi:hypothetical protein
MADLLGSLAFCFFFILKKSSRETVRRSCDSSDCSCLVNSLCDIALVGMVMADLLGSEMGYGRQVESANGKRTTA